MTIDLPTARTLARDLMLATGALLTTATAPGAPPLPPEVLLDLTNAERHARIAWAALYDAHAALDPAEAARQAEGRRFAGIDALTASLRDGTRELEESRARLREAFPPCPLCCAILFTDGTCSRSGCANCRAEAAP